MAILTFGAPVTGIRGTIGGITYTANQAGPYARIWSRGANVRTQSQSTSRASLANLASWWRTISASDRADWDTFAADPAQELTNALSEPYYISGFLWWVKISRELLSADRSPLESGWNVTKPTAPTISTLRVSAGAVTSQITFPDGTFTPSYDCVIFMALAQSIGATAKPLVPRFLDGYQTPPNAPLNISASVAAAFGSVQVGQRAFAEVCRQATTGYRSAPTAIAIDVIA